MSLEPTSAQTITNSNTDRSVHQQAKHRADFPCKLNKLPKSKKETSADEEMTQIVYVQKDLSVLEQLNLAHLVDANPHRTKFKNSLTEAALNLELKHYKSSVAARNRKFKVRCSFIFFNQKIINTAMLLFVETLHYLNTFK